MVASPDRLNLPDGRTVAVHYGDPETCPDCDADGIRLAEAVDPRPPLAHDADCVCSGPPDYTIALAAADPYECPGACNPACVDHDVDDECCRRGCCDKDECNECRG